MGKESKLPEITQDELRELWCEVFNSTIREPKPDGYFTAHEIAELIGLTPKHVRHTIGLAIKNGADIDTQWWNDNGTRCKIYSLPKSTIRNMANRK